MIVAREAGPLVEMMMNDSKRNAANAEAVEVIKSSLHGDGVRAVAPFANGDVVFTEKPQYFLQAIPNRRSVLVCGGCSQFLGSIGLQLKVLQSCVTREELLGGRVADFDPYATLSDGLVPCFAGCGELYCSETCRDAHWGRKGHRFLCTGQIGEAQAASHPLIGFKVHAVQTNEIFLLVADVFAELCAMYEEAVAQGVPREEALGRLSAHFDGFVAQRWWDAALPPKGQSKAKFSKTLKQLVADSYSMLADSLPLHRLGLQQLLSEDFMARCIGMFEQNNVGVRLRNPVGEHCEQLPPTSAAAALLEEVQAVAAAVDSDCMQECEDDGDYEDVDEEDDEEEAQLAVGEGDEGEDPMAAAVLITGNTELDAIRELVAQYGESDLFPPLDGTSFYMLICKINHSCCPNVIVRYAALPGRGLVAQLTALRDIAPGEELLQSYIDQSLPADERQAALAEYGFRCRCPACLN